MFEALKELRNASYLAHDICMGKERIKGQYLEKLELVYRDFNSIVDLAISITELKEKGELIVWKCKLSRNGSPLYGRWSY